MKYSEPAPSLPGGCETALDVQLKTAAALASALFAATILVVDARRPASRLLALFLLLIAGNQGAEVFRAVATSPEARQTWFHVAVVFAAFDPLVLVFFSAVHPTNEPMPRAKLAALAASGLFALTAPGTLVEGYADPFSVVHERALTLYTAAAYVGVFARAARAHVRAPTTSGALLVAALALGAVPMLFRAMRTSIAVGGLRAPLEAAGGTFFFEGTAAFGTILVLAGLGLLLRQGAARARRATLAFGLGALALALTTGGAVAVTSDAAWLGQAGAAVRWLGFIVLVCAAMLRHDALHIGPAARRRGAHLVLAILAVGAAGAILAAIAAIREDELRSIDLVILGAALVASQAFRRVVDRAAAIVFGTQSTSPADAEAPLTAGALLLARYEVKRLVGRGGTGRAFLAYDTVLHRDVVLKEILHDGAEGEVALREARLAGGLAHPHVVVVHDVLRRQGGAIIVQEHVAGGSLADRLERDGPLPLPETLRLCDEILSALATVHARGIVHRDVKPANVLLDAEGRAKIADFGLAKIRGGGTVGPADAFAGTPAFMAPEQREGLPSTFATDLYAVGRLARLCLAPGAPAAVQAALDRACRAAPDERWPSAEAMRSALAEAAAHSQSTASASARSTSST